MNRCVARRGWVGVGWLLERVDVRVGRYGRRTVGGELRKGSMEVVAREKGESQFSFMK